MVKHRFSKTTYRWLRGVSWGACGYSSWSQGTRPNINELLFHGLERSRALSAFGAKAISFVLVPTFEHLRDDPKRAQRSIRDSLRTAFTLPRAICLRDPPGLARQSLNHSPVRSQMASTRPVFTSEVLSPFRLPTAGHLLRGC
jgi:hypothetical protein